MKRYRQILDGTAGPELYDRALFDLSACLHRHHGEKVVILIDEYDSPIHVAHVHRYASRSYRDPGATDPERVYQGFVLGLLAVMEPEYTVRSNRESGEGRPDVVIRSREPGKPAAALELKVARKGRKTAATALEEGLKQIRARRYEAELASSGAKVIHAFAVAFDGKRVWVKAARPRRRP